MPTSFSTLIVRPRSKPYTATLMSSGSPTVGVMENGATCGRTKASRAANKRQNVLYPQRLADPNLRGPVERFSLDRKVNQQSAQRFRRPIVAMLCRWLGIRIVLFRIKGRFSPATIARDDG